MELNLLPNEETFEIVPIGIKYRCEFCNNGEMKVNADKVIYMESTPMIEHVCTKCKKTMLLPKSYPRIEWIPKEEDKNETV